MDNVSTQEEQNLAVNSRSTPIRRINKSIRASPWIPAATFIVTWSSFGQDGSGYGVYARRYNAAGAALDSSEFRVNQTTDNWQYQPDIGMDAKGNFFITWSAFGQENDIANAIKDYGIYARMYNANGSDFIMPDTGLPYVIPKRD